MNIAKNALKIVCISDTHGLHESVQVPDGDILICAGDITNDAGQAALRSFCKWFQNHPHKHKVFIAGNHDWAFEKWPDKAKQSVKEWAPDCIYLENSGCIIEGLNFWGCPWTPRFFDWAFNADRGDGIQKHWDLIPGNTDILITHGPAHGVLSQTNKRVDVGCCNLADTIKSRLNLKLHVFGHIHSAYGVAKSGEMISVNASVCNEAYRPIQKPQVIEITK